MSFFAKYYYKKHLSSHTLWPHKHHKAHNTTSCFQLTRVDQRAIQTHPNGIRKQNKCSEHNKHHQQMFLSSLWLRLCIPSQHTYFSNKQKRQKTKCFDSHSTDWTAEPAAQKKGKPLKPQMTKTKLTPLPVFASCCNSDLVVVWSLLYSAILCSWADLLRLHVILREGLAFHSAFLNTHRSGVLTALMWLESCETAAPNVLLISTPCTVTKVINQIKTEKSGSSPPVNQWSYTDAIKTESMIRNCTGSTKVFTVQNLMDLPKTSPPKKTATLKLLLNLSNAMSSLERTGGNRNSERWEKEETQSLKRKGADADLNHCLSICVPCALTLSQTDPH